jgi:hypothetical protein
MYPKAETDPPFTKVKGVCALTGAAAMNDIVRAAAM